ncbi:MAG: YaiO family outer membrane beta-barrel protein [Geminicoccaceae bacterium]|nr:YaiO family outer membrane beta-barrel protein [Geminicoccaceae bacterium]
MRAPARLWRLGACLLAGAGAAFALPPSPALASTLESAQALRDQGRFAEALALIEAVLPAERRNSDLLLLQGQLLGYLGRSDAALVALAHAEATAPGYAEVHKAAMRVRLGMAGEAIDPERDAAAPGAGLDMLEGRRSFAAGLYPEARAAFAHAAAVEPGRGDAWIGVGDAALAADDVAGSRVAYETAFGLPGTEEAAAGRLAALTREHWGWLLNVTGSFSSVEDGDDWTEGFVGLTRRLQGGALIGGSVQAASRYGLDDQHLAFTYSRHLTEATAGFASLGVTPDADFLPEWRFRTGLEHKLYAGGGRLGATVGFAEGTLAGYDEGVLRALDLGATQYAADGRTWATLRLSGTVDAGDDFDLGASLRLDRELDQVTRVFLGGARARDALEGGSITTDTVFAGLRRDLSDRLTLDLSLAYDRPERGGDRATATAGLSYRFD